MPDFFRATSIQVCPRFGLGLSVRFKGVLTYIPYRNTGTTRRYTTKNYVVHYLIYKFLYMASAKRGGSNFLRLITGSLMLR